MPWKKYQCVFFKDTRAASAITVLLLLSLHWKGSMNERASTPTCSNIKM